MNKIKNKRHNTKERKVFMKNKDKNKNNKNNKNNDVIEKKVNTMEKGKDYFEEVENNSESNIENTENQNDK